jgi:hypothetical protein
MDANDPAVEQIAEADQNLAVFQERYDELAARWQQWIAHRDGLLRHLHTTRIDPRFIPAPMPMPEQPVAPEPTPQPHAAGPFVEPSVSSAAVQAQATQAESTEATFVPGTFVPEAAAEHDAAAQPAPASAPVTAQAVRPRPEVERHTPRILTAPVLLGVSGASLLIAAAIVFVAVTWETFPPFGQGVLVLAVAGAVAYLSLWLKRLTLVITSGAVGVVSMAFAGLSLIAFDRETVALGAFSVPLALVVTCGAGLALARLGIRWVNASAALSLVAAAVGLTWAGIVEISAPGALVWALAGAVTSGAVAATMGVWRGNAARDIVKGGALSWVTMSGLAGPIQLYVDHQRGVGDEVAYAALAPIVVLVMMTWWWPRAAAGPAAFLATFLVAAVADHGGGSGWHQLSAAAIVSAVVVLAGRWVPDRARGPLAIGLAPALTVIGIAAVFMAATLVMSTVATMAGLDSVAAGSLLGGLDPWVGLSAVAAGLALAALRTWGAPASWQRGAPMMSVVLVVLGIATLAYGQAHAIDPSAQGVLALMLAFAALLMLASAWLWESQSTRWIARIGAIVTLTIAGLHGVFALGRAEWSWAPSLLAALLPLAILIASARWWPRAALGPVGLLAPLVVGAVVAHAGGDGWQQLAAVSLSMAAVVGAGRWVNNGARGALMIGVTPAAAGAVGTSVVLGVVVVVTAIAQFANAAGGNADAVPGVLNYWTGLIALGAGLAFAGPRTWAEIPRWSRAGDIAGSVLVAVGVAIVSYGAARDLPIQFTGTLALTVTAGAIVMFASAWLWGRESAVVTARVTSVAFLTVAAFHALIPLGAADTAWWTGLLAALAPAAALAVVSVWWPRLAVGSLTVVVTAVPVTLALHFGAGATVAAAVAATTVAAVLWSGSWLQTSWKPMILAGLLPAFGWAALTSVWTAGELMVRLFSAGYGGSSLEVDPWGTATTAITGIALAALPRWRMPQAVVGATSMVGAGTVLVSAAALTVVLADAWALDGSIAFALSGTIVALGAAACIALWATSTARWANGIGATALLTIAGVNGSLAFGDSGAALWWALILALAPIAVLVVFGRWWSRITLGPAAFLVTLVAGSVAYRLDLSGYAFLACALTGAAAVAWIAVRLTAKRRWPVLAGLVPAIAAGAVNVLVLVAAGLVRVMEPSVAPGDGRAALWSGLAMAALALTMAASGHWRAPALVSNAAALLGASAVLVAVVAFTVHTWEEFPQDSALVAFVGVALSAVAALSMAVWVTSTARWTAGIGAVAWLTLVTSQALLDLARQQMDWWWALAVALTAVALLAIASRWWPLVALGPATFIATMAVPATAAGVGAGAPVTYFAAAAAFAGVVWAARTLTESKRTAVLWGASAVGMVVLYAVSLSAGAAALRLEAFASGRDSSILGGWAAGTVVLAFAAVLSWPAFRRNAGWVSLPFVFVAAACVPAIVAWPALLVLAVVGAIAGRTLRATPEVAMMLALLGLVWASGDDYSIAIAAAVATGVALYTAATNAEPRRAYYVALAPIAGALASAFAVNAFGGDTGLAVAFAMGAALTISIVAARAGLDPSLTTTIVMVALATTIIPWWSPTLTVAGIAVLLAGVAWLALAVLRWKPGRWISIAVLSGGAALILADANVSLIEAYTAVPAVGVLGVGLWWMREDGHVHSLRALGPGLGVALVPSFVALVVQPDSLLRTLILTGVTILMALVGVLLRWFAPILATAVTAVVVSIAQIVVGDNLPIRIVCFAVVGAVLMVMATTYERLKELR